MKFKFGREGVFAFLAAVTFTGLFYFLATTSSITEYFWLTSSAVAPTYNLKSLSGDLQIPDRGGGDRKVAICLVGGLRAFELTGPTIKKYLLDVYRDAHVFVHAPVDDDVHKITALTGVPNLATIRLFVPQTLNETEVARGLLTANGSPNGIQGLLQYFTLVEGCVDMMEDYETRHGFKFDWVIRTRVDGFWNGPMPPVEAFNASKYHVPYGSDFGGLNDRLGAGNRKTSWVALSRLRLLSKIHDLGFRNLNSEKAFAAQFKASKVEVELNQFPFCVLTVRTYAWPIRGGGGVPVASIRSEGPLNGAKCWPCTPQLVGPRVQKILEKCEAYGHGIGPAGNVQLCDPSTAWEDTWSDVYDAAVGSEIARFRKSMTNRPANQCITDVELFQEEWDLWNAPSAQDLCGRSRSSL